MQTMHTQQDSNQPNSRFSSQEFVQAFTVTFLDDIVHDSLPAALDLDEPKYQRFLRVFEATYGLDENSVTFTDIRKLARHHHSSTDWP